MTPVTKFIVLLILLSLLTLSGCEAASTAKHNNIPQTPPAQQAETNSPKPGVDLPKVKYLHPQSFSADQQMMISVINENIKTLNERDEAKHVASFKSSAPNVKELARSGYETFVQERDKHVLSLETAEFKKNNGNANELQVIVSKQIQLNNKAKDENSVYIFKLENDQWNLAYID